MEAMRKYRLDILSNFGKIEEITKIMIQTSHPDLEQKFWNASDAKDLGKLKFLLNQTNKIVDNLKETNNV